MTMSILAYGKDFVTIGDVWPLLCSNFWVLPSAY